MKPLSIRRRLTLGALIVAALLSALLYLSVRSVASAAVEQSGDAILGAAVLSIAEELRGGAQGIAIDLPYAAFSMLGSIGEDRVFYRILMGGETVTGYADLPAPEAMPRGLQPVFYSRPYQDETLRLAAVTRAMLVEGRQVEVELILGQTRSAQEAIVATMASRAAALGLGFFALSALLTFLSARWLLRPVQALAEAVGRRGPDDLRPVVRPAPRELMPLLTALNGFIARLAGALSRTETFIAEAAHHIRTPLATLRAQAEVTLRQSEHEPTRARLREMIRAVDASARSAGQLLDHAAVIYRSDQRAEAEIDLGALAEDLAERFRPAASLHDVNIALSLPEAPLSIHADPLLVESALRNLLDNAVKYSHPEGAIHLTLARLGPCAEITVEDQGRGLAGANGRELGQRFRRGANVEDVVGSGLGLTIVREVTRAQGGEFSLSERTGGGACARLILPLG